MSADVIQGSAEWLAARCGKATASRMADIMAKTKAGWGASRANYLAELVAERLTMRPADGFTNAAMQWGTDKEPEARNAYEFLTGHSVDEVGFVDHPSIPMTGASPDGLVGDLGMVEIKCPNTSTHIDTLLAGEIAHKYVLQMTWQMECTGRRWCDFVSYDPRLPLPMRLFTRRVTFDEALGAELRQGVAAFLAEVDEKVAALEAKFERRAA
jgi:putative phage-type endonuclease